MLACEHEKSARRSRQKAAAAGVERPPGSLKEPSGRCKRLVMRFGREKKRRRAGGWKGAENLARSGARIAPPRKARAFKL